MSAIPSIMHLLLKHCQLKLSQKTMRIALKTTKSFKVFLKCWAHLIVFLVSMPIKSHSGQFFNLFPARQKPRNVLFKKT